MLISSAQYKMQPLLIFTLLFGFNSVLSAPGPNKLELAKPCPDSCQLPLCRCSSSAIPGVFATHDIPQIVLITFDDAVTSQDTPIYETLKDKKNPNGCPISATFFNSHEYTDYSKLHELWAAGHEIALHSITHYPDTDMWKNMEYSTLLREFEDQVQIMEKFGKIPRADIKGMRLPFLQLSGNTSFEVMSTMGLKYDCSWPTQLSVGLTQHLWPYTLNYASTQDCQIGPCPTASFPGKWEVPMVDWTDDAGVPCAMVDACVNIPDDAQNITKFIVGNFERHYKGNRAPFGFYVHSAWFRNRPQRLAAFKEFINYLMKTPNVYIVNIQSALHWIENPQHVQKGLYCTPARVNTCNPKKTCHLKSGDQEYYMTICGEQCPATYPGVGNPFGK